jgi:hypothetical protein
MLPAIQKVTDKLERATIAEEVASYLGISRGIVLEEFRRSAAERSAPPMQTRPMEIPPAERLLLNALLFSAEARDAVLPALASLPVFATLSTRTIFECISGLHGDGSDFSFAEIDARLNEGDRELLSGIVFADEMGEESASLEQALQCLRALEDQSRERERAELRQKIKMAERSGNFDQAMRLMEELRRWEMKRNR